MEAAYGERIEEQAADLAHHLYHAGAAADPEKTLRFLRLAGEQALDGSAYEEALAQFERALSLEEDVPEQLVPVQRLVMSRFSQVFWRNSSISFATSSGASSWQ